MPKKPDDGIVVWEEPDYKFLPEEISKDKLAVFLKLLIGRVKEDHARHAYNKDLIDYRKEIMQVMSVAQQGGYELCDYEPEGAAESVNSPESEDEWDGIVDD